MLTRGRAKGLYTCRQLTAQAGSATPPAVFPTHLQLVQLCQEGALPEVQYCLAVVLLQLLHDVRGLDVRDALLGMQRHMQQAPKGDSFTNHVQHSAETVCGAINHCRNLMLHRCALAPLLISRTVVRAGSSKMTGRSSTS